MKFIINLLAATSTGLMAGLFFAWSFSVTVGLGKLGDKEYLSAFQSMNREIQNPIFLLVFLSAPILLITSTYLNYNKSPSPQFWIFLSATVIYATGSFGVTMFGNIPLNQTLEALEISSMSNDEMWMFRKGFEGPWNNLNMIRTLASMLSFVLFLTGLVKLSNFHKKIILSPVFRLMDHSKLSCESF